MLRNEFEGIPYTHETNRFTLYIPKKDRALFAEIVTYAKNRDRSISYIILDDMRTVFRMRREADEEMKEEKTQIKK